MPTDSEQQSWLRDRWSWYLLILVPYAVSVVWLGITVIVVPIVILSAPMGLVWLSGRTGDYNDPTPLRIHGIFWPIFLVALVGAKHIKISLLRTIFVGLALVITLDCYGCASVHINPLNGWREVGSFMSVPVAAAIRQDALDYFQTMPAFERRGSKDEFNVRYYDDGTGQHAVVLKASKNGEHWQYALIYDRNNKRIRVVLYSAGSYSC